MNTLQEQSSEGGSQDIFAAFRGQFQEIELTLNRIEGAATHYEVLGVGVGSSSEEIGRAFEHAINLLHPSRAGETRSLHDTSFARIEKAVMRLKHASGVLLNDAKKREYDRCLLDPNALPLPSDATTEEQQSIVAHSPLISSLGFQPEDHAETGDTVEIINAPVERFSEFASIEQERERRKFERLSLAIPAYVTGYDRVSGEWHEMTHTIDVSRTGALIRLKRRVRHRSLLHLALPLPMSLRCYRHAEPSYGVYALVRRIAPQRDGSRVIAVEFVGERPPGGFIEKPWATYATKWSGDERRRFSRQSISEIAVIEYLDHRMECISQDSAVAENYSKGGLRISVKKIPPDFELVKVHLPARGLDSLAFVCNRYVGKDRHERLCLQFADSR